jgi:ABC-type sugar transport system permease subunit
MSSVGIRTLPSKEPSLPKKWREPALSFLAPAVFFLALFTLYPFVYSVVSSLFDINLTEPHWGSFQGLGNFVRLFGDSLFQAALFNTLLITVGSILLELVVAFLMAHLFVAIAHLPGSRIVRTLYILPMMITPVVNGYCSR